MDGNGRWAKRRGLPRIEGHRRGVESIRHLLKAVERHRTEYVTLYAFSVENWERPKDEVDALMNLLTVSIRNYRADLIKRRIRLQTIGDLSALPERVREAVNEVSAATAHFDERHLIMALNYGARQELVRACRSLVREAREEVISDRDIDWPQIASRLDTARWPDPDLVIRTSGEQRISNFLLLQSAYAEFFFTATTWPEFRERDFDEAIDAYRSRERRFGRTGEQLKTAPTAP
jgi:undecaprenyl diphosphate synthase